MSKKNNVNPDYYKQGGRNRPDETTPHGVPTRTTPYGVPTWRGSTRSRPGSSARSTAHCCWRSLRPGWRCCC